MPRQVLGIGPAQADICIVGEAAGEDEERAGMPFVGKSGQLLDRLLEDAGINRSECYITNLVKEHPPHNDISKWCKDRILTDIGRDCKDALIAELAAKAPKVVIALGNVSKLAVTGDTRGITQIRGCPQRTLGSAVCIPSIHPAAILRGAWMDRYLLAADLRKAKRFATGATVPSRTLRIHPTPEEAVAYLGEALRAEEIGFDIENSGNTLTCFSVAISPTDAMSISLAPLVNGKRKAVFAALAELLEAKTGPRIVTQNGNYDTYFLREFYGIRTNLARVEDTMCAHHVMLADLGGDEKEKADGTVVVKRSSKSLALLASLYTDEPYYKDEGKTGRSTGDLDTYLRYNAKDAAITLECWQTLKRDLESRPGMRCTYYDLTMPRLQAIQEMQSGLLVDRRMYAELKIEAEKRVKEIDKLLQEEVWEYLLTRRRVCALSFSTAIDAVESADAEVQRLKLTVDKSSPLFTIAKAALKEAKKELTKSLNPFKQAVLPFNPDSPEQCCELFYAFHKLPVRRNKKTKRPTVDDDALAEFARPASTRPAIRAAQLIQDIRGELQQIETFLSWELDSGRFRAAFNPRGTKFGRLSSSKLFFRFGGNQQNIPPSVRRAIVADPVDAARVPFFIEYDKAGAEWVVVAYEADDQKMLKAIATGDIHSYTAHLMYDVPVAEVQEETRIFESLGLGSETSERVIVDVRKKHVYPVCPGLAVAKFFPRNTTFRQGGKKAGHALNYDEGVYTFAKKAGIAVAEAGRTRDLYRSVYSGIPRWHERTQFKLKEPTAGPKPHYKRTLTNCFGREMHFLGPLSGDAAPNTFRQAYACIPQSTVADVACEAMVSVVRNMRGRVSLRSNNHDSLLIQHRYSRPVFATAMGREQEVSRILGEVQEVYNYLDPELKSTYTGKSYRIKTDSKAGLRWGGLVKLKPTRQGVEEMLTRIDKEIGG